MATPNIRTETYAYFMEFATYDMWAKYLGFYADFIEQQRKRGELTDQQVVEIWARYDQLVEAKLQAAKDAGKPSVVIPGHSYTVQPSPKDPNFLQKVGQGWGYLFDQSGKALSNVGGALVGGISVGTYVVLGMMIFVAVSIVKKIVK